jgi:hypothetical protein
MNNEKIFGFYSYGKEWLEGYEIIKKKIPGETPCISLKYYLLCRAIEVFLKAFLLANGMEYEELKKKYGHDIGNLYGKANQLGLKEICKIEKRDEIIIDMLNPYYAKKEFEYFNNDNSQQLPMIIDVEIFTNKLNKSILEFLLKLLRSG